MIAQNLNIVNENINKAMKRRTRVPKDSPVKLVAVTKNHDINAMREAIDAGVTDIGENRIQEARTKFDTLGRQSIWHLIGHLQTNKAKYAVKMFDFIHSVDSVKLVRNIDHEASKIGKVQDILVQVNLAGEEQKSGVAIDGMNELLHEADSLEHIHLRGLMMIAPNYENRELCRPLFRKMYEIYIKTKEIPFKRANIDYLSMGMSHDYEIAIEEGANIVRGGTAIFGPRQY